MTDTTASPRDTREVTRRVFEGALWTALRNSVQTVASLVCIAVVARALGPHAYGVFGAIMLVVTSAEILTGGAFAESLVQRERLEDGHIDATFWLGLGCALGIAAMLALFGGPIAALAGALDAGDLLRACSLLVLVSSLSAVPLALLQRELRFAALARIGGAATVLCSATGIALALAGVGVWTLFFMEAVRLTVSLLGGWLAVGWRPARPGRRGSRRHLRELSRFNRDTMAMYAAGYADMLVPRALIAWLLGPQVLGLYALAMRVFDELDKLVTHPLSLVSLPACARLQHDRPALRRLIAGLYDSARVVAYPVFIGMALLAPVLIVPLLGAQWAAAVAPIQLLMLGGLRSATAGFTVSILRGIGRSELPLLLFVSGCLWQVLLIPAFAHWGVIGMACAVLGRGIGNWPLSCWLIQRTTGMPAFEQLRGGGATLVATAAMALLVWSIIELWSVTLAWPVLTAVAVTAGALYYVAVMWLLSPATVRRAIVLLRALVRRDRAAIEQQAGAQ